MASRKNKGKKHLRITRRNKPYFIGGSGEDKCIFVPLGAGLGNQMYIYAAGMTAKKKTGLPICLLPNKSNAHSEKDYSTILFIQGKPVDYASVKNRMNVSKKILECVRDPHNVWKEENINVNTTKNALLAGGFFQSYKSVSSVLPDIRNDCEKVFQERYPRLKADSSAQKQAASSAEEQIDTGSSAFMHLRRGDYGSAILPLKYYIDGITILDSVPKIQKIYIVSDDMKWCKEQKWPVKKNIIYFDEPDELKTMYLMSLCLAGACISASTFSSWGAMLGADKVEDSTIIYPLDWITGPSSKIGFPERWKAI
jgi:hypothetical protein